MERGSFLTLTAVAFKTGEHSRHKELVRDLLSAGEEVIWIGPSAEDIADLVGVIYLPLVGHRLLGAPLLGRIGAYLLSLARHRHVLGRVERVFVLRDLELLAIRLFPGLSKRPTTLVLRNDLVRKARARAELASSPMARLTNRLRAALFTWLQRRLYPSTGRIIVQTPAIAEEIRQRLGNQIPRPEVVPNDCSPSWTETPAIDLRRQWQDNPNQRLIGFVANLLWEVKGLALLFATFAEIRRLIDAKLVIVGGGPDLDRVRRHARSAPFRGAVEIVGPVTNGFQLMANFDLMLVTSQYDDCPNVILEALKANVPLVATEIEAHSFLLGSDLVTAADSRALATRALRLMEDPDARREALAAQESQRKRFDFDWGSTMVAQLRGLDHAGRALETVGSRYTP